MGYYGAMVAAASYNAKGLPESHLREILRRSSKKFDVNEEIIVEERLRQIGYV
jgi:hypothetical protein